jgi:glutamate racemase
VSERADRAGVPGTRERSSRRQRSEQGPIGVFDSGVGGLTVLKELRRQLPGESTIYLGDEARMPYGPRPASEIVAFTREALRWFAARNCKLIVLACNTATSVALESVRDEVPVPIIGVVRPGAAAAIAASARRAIGVLATLATVRSGAYVRAVRDLDPLADVIQMACPKLVPIVEEGKAGTPEALAAVRMYVGPLITEGGVVTPVVDTLLLGCTHYPLLAPLITAEAGTDVAVIDSAGATASALAELLDVNALAAPAANSPSHQQLTTGDVGAFRRTAERLFGDVFPSVAGVVPGGIGLMPGEWRRRGG